MPPNKSARSAEPELPRRQLAGTLALGALMLAAFGVGLATIHESSRRALDEQMGERLLLIAAEAAAAVEPDSVLAWTLQDSLGVALATAALARDLNDLVRERELNYVVVYSFETRVLVDTSRLRPLQQLDPYLFDLVEFERALAGAASHTRTEAIVDEYLKSAYAPVLSHDGRVQAVVAVQARPDFFDTLRGLRRTLMAVGLGVALLVGVMIASYLYFARRLARARAALVRGETLAAMGRMAAGIAHEIRNPLGIIKNSAQLLRRELAEEGRGTDLVDFIPAEVDRLSETLTGYLEFAKDAPLRPEPTDLVALCRRTLKLLAREAETAAVRVQDELDAVDGAHATVDPRRLQQVLLNLGLNAVQAMPGGGTLRVRLEPSATAIAIAVSDTGPGMNAAQAAAVFEPFVTTKEKGSGLGLFIARRIVEEHGGRLEVVTAPGEGSTFTIRLPRDGASR